MSDKMNVYVSCTVDIAELMSRKPSANALFMIRDDFGNSFEATAKEIINDEDILECLSESDIRMMKMLVKGSDLYAENYTS